MTKCCDSNCSSPYELRKKLQNVINSVSAENGSDTPDFILAEYLNDCLISFDRAVRAREKWYGREPEYVPFNEVSEECQKENNKEIDVDKPEEETLWDFAIKLAKDLHKVADDMCKK